MMLKTLLLVVIATVNCSEIRGRVNPIQQSQNGVADFHPRSDWSWVPSMPSFFKYDDDDEDISPKILKRLDAVEQMLKELNERLKQESKNGFKKPENTTTSNDKVEALPSKGSPPKPKPQNEKEQPQTSDDTKPGTITKPTQPMKTTETVESDSKPEEPIKNTDTKQDENPTNENANVETKPSYMDEAVDAKENFQRKKRV